MLSSAERRSMKKEELEKKSLEYQVGYLTSINEGLAKENHMLLDLMAIYKPMVCRGCGMSTTDICENCRWHDLG